jgi:hypothetical protein
MSKCLVFRFVPYYIRYCCWLIKICKFIWDPCCCLVAETGSWFVRMELHTLKNVNSYWNTKFYFYLETSGGEISNLYFNFVHFSMPILIRHMLQLKTVVFLHGCSSIVMLSCCFRCDQIHNMPYHEFVHTLLCFTSLTSIIMFNKVALEHFYSLLQL